MEIKAPDLGVDSAEVSEIMVSVGDVIAKDDNIVLLESDKASVEVPSSAAGKVVSIAISVGDQVSEGSLLITLEAEDSAEAATDTEAAEDNNAAEPAEAAPAQAEPASEPAKEQAAPVETAAAAPQTYALPDLGVEEAQVAEIMVEVGDTVTADQSILLIESDKASVEVPAPVAGKVEKILVANGDTVANGQDFIVIVSSEAAASSQSEEQTPAPAAKQEEQAKPAAPKAEQTDKQTDPNKTSGKPTQALAKLDENQVNQKLTEVYAGPAVRKLARQLGIDITQVAGTATNERIVKEDVFGYVKAHITNGAGNTAAAAPTGAARSGLPALPDMSKTEIWGETETIDLTRLQKVSIPQLNYNTYLPQVTQFDLADITDTEALRGELKGDMKKQGIGLTILAFIVKATAYALTQHPKFNSHLSDDNSQVILRKSVNMGIAVATDDGLIVPVIKDAQAKGIKQLAIEIGELAGKARDKKLGTKDLQGASFTISSQGNLGGTYFTPLVNWPQVGIMGVSEATMQPRWNAEQQTFEPRLMLPLSLSYDHRVINGADAAVFTRYVAQLLADPRRILL